MTRFKDTGPIALIDTRPSEHKGLKPPAITPQPTRKENDQSRKRSDEASNKTNWW